MKLTFIYAPVPDLGAALPFYRDVLALDEAWREGADTVAFHTPDRKAQIMVTVNTEETPGAMYLVDSVTTFLAEHPEVEPFMGPRSIPDGSVAGIHDPAGNAVYIFDQPGA